MFRDSVTQGGAMLALGYWIKPLQGFVLGQCYSSAKHGTTESVFCRTHFKILCHRGEVGFLSLLSKGLDVVGE